MVSSGVGTSSCSCCIYAVVAVDNGHAAEFRRTDRIGRKRHDVVVPLNNVDLFAAQFADDRLNARAFHADAGAHRVDISLSRCHGNFGSFTSFARDAFDLHGSIVDFRDFRLEQMLDQFRGGAGDDHLRTLRRLVDFRDNHAKAIADGKVFEPRLVAFAKLAFGLAQIDNDVAVLKTLDDTVHHFADMLWYSA